MYEMVHLGMISPLTHERDWFFRLLQRLEVSWSGSKETVLDITITNSWSMEKHRDREEKDRKLSGGVAFHKDFYKEKMVLCEK